LAFFFLSMLITRHRKKNFFIKKEQVLTGLFYLMSFVRIFLGASIAIIAVLGLFWWNQSGVLLLRTDMFSCKVISISFEIAE
jgi:hypothetical protein